MKRLLTIEMSSKRNFGLDLLRFIAILTVLISHSVTLLPPKFKFIELFITDGVLIFFVLSGFLIGRILIRDFENGMSSIKLLNFWKRRWWRTLPAYYFTIIIIIILSTIINQKTDLIEVFKSILFIQNITSAPKLFFTESWSLSIEEWFYLSLPILLFFLFKFSNLPIKKTILIAFAVILVLSLAFRIYIFNHNSVSSLELWDQKFRKPVLTRLDSILLGVLGAWVYIFKNDWFRKNSYILFIVGVILFFVNKIYYDYFAVNYNFYTCVVYFTIIPFSILLMLPKIYFFKPLKLKPINYLITYTSLISYSLYLLNFTVIIGLILNNLTIHYFYKFLLFWILSFLFSTLMYKYIEQYFLKLRD